MEDKFEKIVIVCIICLFGWAILSSINKSNENKYIVNTPKGIICGKEVYITDFTYENELETEHLLKEIEYLCEEYYTK